MTAAAGDALSHLHRRRSSTLIPDDSSDADSAAVSIGTSSSLGHDEDNRSGLKCMGPMNPLAGTVEGPESFTIALLAETSSKQMMT